MANEVVFELGRNASVLRNPGLLAEELLQAAIDEHQPAPAQPSFLSEPLQWMGI